MMDKLVSLSKRRGFIFQGSEIYGGLGAIWDYGPLGVELKNNIKAEWWRANVQERDDVVGIDAAILMHPRTWEASGHIESFYDRLIDCKGCKRRFRAEEVDKRCPVCGGELTEPRTFNLMFKTFVGPVEEEAMPVYLRPETAQGIFVNFSNVLTTMRKKLPFGIAQIGKAFRNEITTGNFILRTREFEQMEIEYFVKPEDSNYWFERWIEERFGWYVGIGLKEENLRTRFHGKDELAHYALACCDIEYKFPIGWVEIEGIANRGDFDLKRHSEYSGERLTYFDEEKREHIFPYVIEPSSGVDRIFLALMADAYDEDVVEGERRVVLRFLPKMAPIKAAVLPLLRREPLIKLARDIYARLRKRWMVQYDEVQSIGRRYRRQDEIGTPFCVTIDPGSLEDNMVTIRERDTTKQMRVPIDILEDVLERKIKGEPFDILPEGGRWHYLGEG